MLTYLVAFCISLLAALALTPVVRWSAFRFGLVDDGSEARKVHDRPIPRLGGVAIVIAFFLPVAALLFVDNDVSAAYLGDEWRVWGLVGGSALVVALGLADDLLNLPAKFKLLAQVAIAVGVYYMGFEIGQVATPFGWNLQLGVFAMPVTVIWIVGVMNAINLIDGLDGLAGGIALFAVVTLFILGLLRGQIILSLTSAALAGSLIGFLRYNFNPASIFMGDSGSLFLGFILATTAIWGSSKSSTIVALMIPILALGLPLFDTGVAILRRFLGGRGIFSADRGHVHHRLLDLGLTHKQVVLVMYAVSIGFTVLALSLVYANGMVGAVILGVFLVAVIVFARLMGLLSLRTINQTVKYGLMRQTRGLRHLQVIESTVERVRLASSSEQVLTAIEQLGQDARLDEITLHAALSGGPRLQSVELDWERENTDVTGRLVSGQTPAPAQAVQKLEYDLRWSLEKAEIVGRISFSWHCEPDQLQVPEAAGYHLLALTVRDRLLQLAVEQSVVTLGPRLVES